MMGLIYRKTEAWESGKHDSCWTPAATELSCSGSTWQNAAHRHVFVNGMIEVTAGWEGGTAVKDMYISQLLTREQSG